MAKEHDAWLERKKEREEKIKRGEKVGPEEPDPTAEPEIGCLGLLKFLVIALVTITLAGKFFTGSYLWELEPPNWRQFIPVSRPTSLVHSPFACSPLLLMVVEQSLIKCVLIGDMCIFLDKPKTLFGKSIGSI